MRSENGIKRDRDRRGDLPSHGSRHAMAMEEGDR